MTTQILSAVIAAETAIIIFLLIRWHRRRKVFFPLLGVLETLRRLHQMTSTSQAGKGIIPRQLWNEIIKVVGMTSHIKTSDFFKQRGRK